MIINSHSKASIKTKVTVMVVLGLSLVMVVLLAWVGYLFKERTEQILRSRANVIVSMNAASIALPLWDYNEEQVRLTLNALADDRDFVYAVVHEQNGEVFQEKGVRPVHDESSVTIVKRDVVYTDGEKREVIGNLSMYFSTKSISQSLQKALMIVIPGFLLFTLLLGLLVYNIVRGFTLPVEQLASAMANYENGQRDFVLPKNIATREMDHLVRAFVGMKDKYDHFNEELRQQVDERTQELKQYQEHLERLVEDQVRDIKKSKDEAEAANRIKSEFLANMSHELRTPVHAIINYSALGITSAEKGEKEKIVKFCTNINKSGNRLLSLLNNLLDLSKMEAGSMEYHLKEHSLKGTLEYVTEELQSLLEVKKLKFDTQFRTDNLTAMYDEPRITQVLVNLLSNAIKFTEEGKRITARLEDGHLQMAGKSVAAIAFVLEDQGVGIPEEELELIFDKFVQSNKTKTGAGGTGLGLAICRSIVEAHHGKIWAENTGGGARFTVMLPRQPT